MTVPIMASFYSFHRVTLTVIYHKVVVGGGAAAAVVVVMKIQCSILHGYCFQSLQRNHRCMLVSSLLGLRRHCPFRLDKDIKLEISLALLL